MSDTLSPTRDALLGLARTLPAAPQILFGICELLEDVNTDLDHLANEIRRDAALATRVIRVSNSVVYGGGGSIASVDEAVSRVGFAEVVRLVGTATAAGLADRELRCYHLAADTLREALLMHALASEALAATGGLDDRRAYLAGLLRGIGTMVLDRYGRERLNPEQLFDPATFGTYGEWENRHFGVTATAVTMMAMDDWRFPEEVVTAIERHLDPAGDGSDADRLAAMLNLAGAIATEHGRALPGEIRHWAATPDRLAAAGLDQEQFDVAASRAAAEFERQKTALY